MIIVIIITTRRTMSSRRAVQRCGFTHRHQIHHHHPHYLQHQHQHCIQVYLVLEEDGTEVDDEEYFQTLPDNTMFMLLFIQVLPTMVKKGGKNGTFYGQLDCMG